MDYIHASGTHFEIREVFSEHGIKVGTARGVLEILLNNPKILGKGEYIEKKSQKIEPGVLYYMIEPDKYYINLKSTTVWTAIHILYKMLRLDQFCIPIIDILLSEAGISVPTLVKLSELFGETCIVRETLLRKEKVGSCDILEPFEGKCCNNDLKCRFREGDDCHCTMTDVWRIYDGLVEENMFKRNGDKFEYQW